MTSGGIAPARSRRAVAGCGAKRGGRGRPLLSPAVLGLETSTVQVEVDLRAGLPSFSVVGLADVAVQEARERVRSGLANQAFTVPARRIVANLAPADLRKAGPQYDLPPRTGDPRGVGAAPRGGAAGLGAVGELALDGGVRPVSGAIAMAEHAAREGWARMIVPAANAAEAALVPGVEVIGVATLRDAVDVLEGRVAHEPVIVDAGSLLAGAQSAPGPDLGEVRGQGSARRALEVAAAGGHSMLMIGPPGGGKTMLARRLPGILPPLGLEEAIAVTRIHSVAGLLDPGCPLVVRRPFRAPHHTVSAAGLVGGGRIRGPGEVSLAHHGVLFLDEVCAFAPSALDALRQPLEEGRIDVTRSMMSARFPGPPVAGLRRQRRCLLRSLSGLNPQHHRLRHAVAQPGPLPLPIPPAVAHELLYARRERLPFEQVRQELTIPDGSQPRRVGRHTGGEKVPEFRHKAGVEDPPAPLFDAPV